MQINPFPLFIKLSKAHILNINFSPEYVQFFWKIWLCYFSIFLAIPWRNQFPRKKLHSTWKTLKFSRKPGRTWRNSVKQQTIYCRKEIKLLSYFFHFSQFSYNFLRYSHFFAIFPIKEWEKMIKINSAILCKFNLFRIYETFDWMEL